VPTDPEAKTTCDRLRALDSCALSDALDALALSGVLAGIAPRWEGARVVGRVITMQLADGPARPDAPKVHLGAAAITASSPGDVIVVSNGGRVGMGSWGGLLSVAAMTAGVAGVVTDGACRDVDEARELKFPIFARAAVPVTARGRVHEVSSGEPIEIGGVTMQTGDYVLADGTGVVVVAADHLEDVLAKAEEITSREALMLTDIRAGKPVADVMGAQYEDMLRPQQGDEE
jgi:regulator of RNase E activity RraA